MTSDPLLRRTRSHPAPPAGLAAAWHRLDWAALAVVTIGAALVRLAGLNRPAGLVFDEIFYARDACVYVGSGCGITELTNRAHPPLGKWLIAGGIKLFGYNPFGWRIAAAVAGIVTVVLLYLLARRVLRGAVPPVAATIGAFAAAGLLASDLLHIVQSRVAMLDVFATLFSVLAVLCVVFDRDRSRLPARGLRRLALGRPWRLAAGIALGAATATKWNGAYVALAVVGLSAAWEVAARRRSAIGTTEPAMPWSRPVPWWRAVRQAVRAEALPTLVLLGLVPLLVYLASYIGRMPGALVALPWQPGSVWRGIWDHQVAMLAFHRSLGGNHPYESPPWSWLLLKRPVAYYFAQDGGRYREILAVGNPVVWWPAALALVGLAVAWARSRWSLLRPEPIVLAAALATFAPWLILAGNRHQVFIWYLLPTVPFLCLALGLVAAWAWRTLAGRAAGALFAGAVIGSFAFYFPLATALPLTPDNWRARILFTDCARPAAPTLVLPDDQVNRGPPPNGWCWI